MRWLVVLLVVVAQCLQAAVAANILALCVVASHSHSLWCYKYMAALADKGHKITVLGVDKPKIKIPNLTTFIATGVYEALASDSSLSTDWVSEEGSKIQSMYPGFQSWNAISTTAVMHSQAFKDLINKYKDIEKPFDLIIHDNGNAEALLGLVPLFGNPPLLLATTYGSPQWMTFRAGNIFNPAYVPSMITSSDQYMSFYERCVNTFYYVFLEWYSTFVAEPFQDKLMREVFGNHLPYVKDIAKRANIVIVNYHHALNDPRPLLPGVIGIAGLHISEPQPLPQDIKDFMDGAENGVILLSFGTNLDSNWLPKGFENTVLKGLAQVPQRVLWKWDKILPNIPPNIKMSQWLPQGDMLVHPKMRLFITHCGLLSTQEAMYRKVPVLALPVFLDQIENAAMLVKRNLTIRLSVFKLTPDELRDGIRQVLSNPMYKRNMEKMGELMLDMPNTSKEQAVFWTEYAIRHQGAAHLRAAAADMPWYQLLLFDVIAVAVFFLCTIIGLVLFLIVFLYKRLGHSKPKTKSD